jgi:hypothetical protein
VSQTNIVSVRQHVKRAFPFLLLWFAGVLLYSQFNWVFDYRTLYREAEPFESLAYGLPRVTAEVLALYFVLRPSSFRWSWGRVLVALALFIPWFFYCVQFIMHAPGWVIAHNYWLLAVVVGLVVLLVVCIVGAWLTARKPVPA